MQRKTKKWPRYQLKDVSLESIDPNPTAENIQSFKNWYELWRGIFYDCSFDLKIIAIIFK